MDERQDPQNPKQNHESQAEPRDPDAAYRRPPNDRAQKGAAYVPNLDDGRTRRLSTVPEDRTEEIALAAAEWNKSARKHRAMMYNKGMSPTTIHSNKN